MELDNYLQRLSRIGAGFKIHEFKLYSKLLEATTDCSLWLVDFRRIHTLLPALRDGSLEKILKGSKDVTEKDSSTNESVPAESDTPDTSTIESIELKQNVTESGEVDTETQQFRELVHTVCGLHDTALGSMSPSTIYSNISEKHSRTMIVLLDVNSSMHLVRKRYKQRLERERRKAERRAKKLEAGEELSDESEESEESESDETSSDRYETDDEDVHYLFDDVFSSADETSSEESGEEEEEEEEDDEVDFSVGCHAFIEAVRARKTRQRKALEEETEASEGATSMEIGMENRLMAACTFSMRTALRDAAARLVHLKLLAVRHSFRGARLGARLVECLKDRTLLGEYDALVTHADPDAVGFFDKLGFSDDPFLNRNWRAFEFEYTNARLMTYVPAFSHLNVRLAEHARHQLVPSTTFRHAVQSAGATRDDSKKAAANEQKLFDLLAPKNTPPEVATSAPKSDASASPTQWDSRDVALHTALNMGLLDTEIRSWQRAQETAHASMYVLVEKLRHAVAALREEGRKDAELVRSLAGENSRLREQNASLQRSVLLYRKIVLDTLDDDESANKGELEQPCSSADCATSAEALRILHEIDNDAELAQERNN